MWVKKKICGVVFSRKRSRPHVNPMSVGLTGLELESFSLKGGEGMMVERGGGVVERRGGGVERGGVERGGGG